MTIAVIPARLRVEVQRPALRRYTILTIISRKAATVGNNMASVRRCYVVTGINYLGRHEEDCRILGEWDGVV